MWLGYLPHDRSTAPLSHSTEESSPMAVLLAVGNDLEGNLGMQTSDSLAKIAPAIVKAQSELKHAVKESSSEAFKRNGKAMKYADLTAVWDAAKPVLTANKLAALQDVVTTDAGLGVRTRLIHESGEWIEFDPPIIPLEKRNAHGAGSVLTYGRRYSLSAALGVVADEDDDGNAASAAPGNGVADAQKPKAPQASGIMQARQWITAEIHDLNGMNDATELMGHMNDNRAKWVRLREGYPKLWTAPEESGPSQVAMKVAMRLECGDEMARFLNEVEGEADNRAFNVAAE